MKALRRCSNNIEADNVVLIDVDNYNFNNVIVIDVPETISKKVTSSRTYIYIDDDEIPTNTGPTYENISPVKLSKGKRTYSGIGTSNRNSFSLQSDSDSDDEENLDCEFMEDFSGKLREQWEKASLKRNKNKQKYGQASTSKGKSSEWNNDNMGEERFRGAESSMSDCDERDKVGDDSDESGNCSQSGQEEEMHSNSNSDQEEKNEIVEVPSPTIDDVSVESSIIDQREKIKETDEYKRALEEELSARQTALKIQAEEAQHLRRLQKRKKAETLRLLDMERRQKQRVEEIRKSHKKDEENMNLKEVYRTEVRRELIKLENTCLNMASLLRGLGIQVGPLPHEVRAAYKRALLSFHPDRASGSDMRQQVEAEEKFKLISRMKEKFSLY